MSNPTPTKSRVDSNPLGRPSAEPKKLFDDLPPLIDPKHMDKEEKKKNAVHHGFFVTVSLPGKLHQTHYDEAQRYANNFSIYYGIKAEDVKGEGKTHLHMIDVRDWACKRPYEKGRNVDQYGPMRLDLFKKHFKLQCPAISAEAISRHSITVHALTSTYWLEYLNKETMMTNNNFPEDICMLTQYFSEKTEEKARPIDADVKAYNKIAESGAWWAVQPPTFKSCRRFYRVEANKNKRKNTLHDDGTKNCQLRKKATMLFHDMTNYCFSSDDSDEDEALCKAGKHKLRTFEYDTSSYKNGPSEFHCCTACRKVFSSW